MWFGKPEQWPLGLSLQICLTVSVKMSSTVGERSTWEVLAIWQAVSWESEFGWVYLQSLVPWLDMFDVILASWAGEPRSIWEALLQGGATRNPNCRERPPKHCSIACCTSLLMEKPWFSQSDSKQHTMLRVKLNNMCNICITVSYTSLLFYSYIILSVVFH